MLTGSFLANPNQPHQILIAFIRLGRTNHEVRIGSLIIYIRSRTTGVRQWILSKAFGQQTCSTGLGSLPGFEQLFLQSLKFQKNVYTMIIAFIKRSKKGSRSLLVFIIMDSHSRLELAACACSAMREPATCKRSLEI